MTKAEREELLRLLKASARVAGKVADQRAAELMADVEAQLAKEYKSSDPIWAELTSQASAVVRDADAEIARRCRTLGIPEEFRPHLTIGWHRRGENGLNERRSEIRRVAQTRIDAMAKAAKVEIESKALEGQRQLAIGALESEEAKAFLAAMPTVGELMPALDVTTLRSLKP